MQKKGFLEKNQSGKEIWASALFCAFVKWARCLYLEGERHENRRSVSRESHLWRPND